VAGDEGRLAAREPPVTLGVAGELVVEFADRADGWFLGDVQYE
jgi:hypothetical protein